MTSPTALIAEDEPLMRERLKEKLAEVWPELTIVAEASSGDAALDAFAVHRPQIAFLDIRMPGRTGLDVAAEAFRQLDREGARLATVGGGGRRQRLV